MRMTPTSERSRSSSSAPTGWTATRALPWLRTVVKHEALAVRAARQRLLGGGDVDLEARENREAPTPEERAADADALTRSAEALQRLKPQEVRALLLKAQGHSYKEIGELTGWSYTKVNRCLTEGRRRFLERYALIESGAECERWADVLSALADGEASSADLLAVRPHLRNCPACRARIREFQRVPRALGAVVPVAVLALGDAPGRAHGAAPRALGRAYEAVMAGLPDRMVASAQRLHAGLEAASSGKLAAVAMSATALGGGVAAVDDPPAGARHRTAAASASPRRVCAWRPPTPAVAAGPRPASRGSRPAVPRIRHLAPGPSRRPPLRRRGPGATAARPSSASRPAAPTRRRPRRSLRRRAPPAASSAVAAEEARSRQPTPLRRRAGSSGRDPRAPRRGHRAAGRSRRPCPSSARPRTRACTACMPA